MKASRQRHGRALRAVGLLFPLIGILILSQIQVANAATQETFDCWPGVSYTVTRSDQCDYDMRPNEGDPSYYSSDGNARGEGDIEWYSNGITVTGYVIDDKEDGKAPFAQTRVNGGTPQTIVRSSTFMKMGQYMYSGTVSDNSTVEIRMCNGSSGGAAINCNGWHGPFHRY